MENPNYESQKIMDLTDQHIMHTYARQPIVLARGEGTYIWDLSEKKYLDFLTGISVMNLGHRVPQVLKKIEEQISQLFHCSNIYYTVPAALLAEKLTARTFADRVFLILVVGFLFCLGVGFSFSIAFCRAFTQSGLCSLDTFNSENQGLPGQC